MAPPVPSSSAEPKAVLPSASVPNAVHPSSINPNSVPSSVAHPNSSSGMAPGSATHRSLDPRVVRATVKDLSKAAAVFCNRRRLSTLVQNVARASTLDVDPGDDPALLNLANECLSALAALAPSPEVVIPSVTPCPGGMIWSRLLSNLRAPKEFEEEFFVPYLGDSEEKLASSSKLASELIDNPPEESAEESAELAMSKKALEAVKEAPIMKNVDVKITDQGDDSDAEGELLYSSTPDLDDYVNGLWSRSHKRLAVRNVAKAFPTDYWPILITPLAENLSISRDAVYRYLSNAMYRENKWSMMEKEHFERCFHEVQIVKHFRGSHRPKYEMALTSDSVTYFLCRQCYSYDCQMHGDDTAKPSVLPFDRSIKQNCPPLVQRQIEQLCNWRGRGRCWYQSTPPTANSLIDISKVAGLGYLVSELRKHFGDDDFCRIAAAMSSENCCAHVSCHDVGYYVNKGSGSIDVPPRGLIPDPKKFLHKKRKLPAEILVSGSNLRPDYVACKHAGPCTKNNCTCVKNGLPCEKFCGCNLSRRCGDRVQTTGDMFCRNAFIGCQCKSATACQTKVCDCFANFRECDPDLCKPCMHFEIGADRKVIRKCKNSSLRFKERHRLATGRSRVHGWGVYSTAVIPKGDLIGEYVGEVITQDQAERRGRVYDEVNYSFLFGATKDANVDSTRMGNKLRYINHSAESPNCKPRLSRVSGDMRIGLYATRNIVPFEELFFNYNYGKNGPSWGSGITNEKRKRQSSNQAARKGSGSSQAVQNPQNRSASNKGSDKGPPTNIANNGSHSNPSNLASGVPRGANAAGTGKHKNMMTDNITPVPKAIDSQAKAKSLRPPSFSGGPSGKRLKLTSGDAVRGPFPENSLAAAYAPRQAATENGGMLQRFGGALSSVFGGASNVNSGPSNVPRTAAAIPAGTIVVVDDSDDDFQS